MHLDLTKEKKRMTELTTINTNNYAAMAKMMGMNDDAKSSKKSNTLNRLRIWHQPVMGQAEINGKLTNVEAIEGGTFRLEVINGDSSEYFYSKTITVRPFMQRFMYRRYVANLNAKANEPKGTFQRTIMSDSLSVDLKDNTGRFNCGKPTGYIEDFKALPPDMQDLIRQIKRVRVVFGVVTMDNAMDANGNPVDSFDTPFIWEIDNKDAFKSVGEQFGVFAKQERLPLQHNILFLECKKNDLPNGSSYYTPVCKADMSVTHEITDDDHDMFGNFLEWVKNYNDYVCKEWEAKSIKRHEEMAEDDKDVVEDFIDIELEEEVA
jgi:hypothetical protein